MPLNHNNEVTQSRFFSWRVARIIIFFFVLLPVVGSVIERSICYTLKMNRTRWSNSIFFFFRSLFKPALISGRCNFIPRDSDSPLKATKFKQRDTKILYWVYAVSWVTVWYQCSESIHFDSSNAKQYRTMVILSGKESLFSKVALFLLHIFPPFKIR